MNKLSHDTIEAAALPGFKEHGFSEPVHLMPTADAHWLAQHLCRTNSVRAPDWRKAKAVIDPTIFRLAQSDAIVRRLQPLLGDDIVLWGADFVSLKPGQRHAWHVDIESGLADGPCVSVWIGLKETSARSGLTMVSGSHRFPKILQQMASEDETPYAAAADDQVLAWAHLLDPGATLVTPDAADGDAVFFDGRLWHRSENKFATRIRRALLLQYASAETAIHIPDMDVLDWPLKLKAVPRPPSILVSGQTSGQANRIVPPPALKDRDMQSLSTLLHEYHLPLEEDPESGWKAYNAFFAQTAALDVIGCHTSVLRPGHCPHPPHIHPEEEILIVLDGEAEALLATSPNDPAPKVERLSPHQFAYYPAGQHHTIRNTSDKPVTYLMLRWRGSPSGAQWPLETKRYDASVNPKPYQPGLALTVLADEPTGMLSKLHIHLSEMAPGEGYEPHIDAYDAVILTLSGTIEILGSQAPANTVAAIAAGEPHGIRNKGTVPARYLVFELHRNNAFIRDMPPWLRKARRLKGRARRFAGKALRKMRAR